MVDQVVVQGRRCNLFHDGHDDGEEAGGGDEQLLRSFGG
jgi:hypothetical protein